MLACLSCHCTATVGDACRSCWAMAMQLECCRLCCSLPQSSWRSWPSQSPSPSQHPYSGPGGPCKDTLKSSGIGAPPLPPPNTPNPLSLCFVEVSPLHGWFAVCLCVVQMTVAHVQLLFVLAPPSVWVSVPQKGCSQLSLPDDSVLPHHPKPDCQWYHAGYSAEGASLTPWPSTLTSTSTLRSRGAGLAWVIRFPLPTRATS